MLAGPHLIRRILCGHDGVLVWLAPCSVSAVPIIGGCGLPGWWRGGIEQPDPAAPADLGRSRHFYRDVLGLAIYREFGSPTDPGVVFFLGPGFLEVSGHADGAAGRPVMIWLRVRDVNAGHERLAAAGVRILRAPVTGPWGLAEMWIEDPDGVQVVLVEVAADHPVRRDPRSSPAS